MSNGDRYLHRLVHGWPTRVLFFLLLGLIGVGGISATEVWEWTGATDNTWTDPGNWTLNDGTIDTDDGTNAAPGAPLSRSTRRKETE